MMFRTRWSALLALMMTAGAPLMAAVQQDTVTIGATVSTASEENFQPGQFLVSRGTGSIGVLEVSIKITDVALRPATPTTDYILELQNGVVWTPVVLGALPFTFTATIPDGSTGLVVRITPVDDPTAEGAESVDLEIQPSASTYIVGTASSAAVTIADNDRTLSITTTDPRAAERSASHPVTDVGLFTFTLTPAPLITDNISFDLLLGGTGTSGVAAGRGTDYTPGFDTGVMWTAYNFTTKVLTTTSLSLVKGGTYWIEDDIDAGLNPRFITISDIVAGVVTISADPSGEADTARVNGRGRLWFIVNASDIKVGFGTTGQRQLIIIPVQDTEVEGVESAVVSLRASPNYKLASPTTGEVLIADDEILASISSTSDAGVPSLAGTITVNLSTNAGTALTAPRNISVPFQVVRDAAQIGVNPDLVQQPYAFPGRDYTATGLDAATGLGTLVIPQGQSSGVITINPTATPGFFGDSTAVKAVLLESMSYNLQSTGGSSTNPSATISIANSLGEVSLSTLANGYESSLTPLGGTFTVSIARKIGVTAAALAVPFSLAGTASSTDYDIGPAGSVNFNTATRTGTITIPVGTAGTTQTATVTFTPTDDQIREGDETVLLTLQPGQRFNLSPTLAITGTAQILDDEPVVSVAMVRNAVEGGQTGVFRVSYPLGPDGGSLQRAVTVAATMTGTATLNTDYTIPVITIPAGVNSVDVPITAVDDGTVDNNETVILTVQTDAQTKYGITAPTSATLTISDGSPVISVAAGTTPAETGGADGSAGTSGTFRISTDRVLGRDVTVTYTMTGTATAAAAWVPGVRYLSLSGTATVLAGATFVDVPVVPFNDTIPNPNATITMTIAAGANSLLGSPSVGTLILTDNDTDPNLAIPILLSSPDADGIYAAGQTIRIQVTWSQDVLVSGSPGLNLALGALVRRATYIGGNKAYPNGSRGGDVLTFAYTIDAADFSSDLDIALPALLVLDLGSQINDGNGAPASLVLPAPGSPNGLGGTRSFVIRGVNGTTAAPAKPSSAIIATTGDGDGSCGKGIGLGAILGTLMLVLVRRRRV